MQLSTLATLAGEAPLPGQQALVPPIVTATSFAVTPGEVGFSAEDMADEQPYLYSRWANPTVRALENKLSALEGAEDAVVFSSGMGAASGLLIGVLGTGRRLIISDVCYPGVAEFAGRTLRRYGVEVVTADLSNLDEVRETLRGGAGLVYAETPCNPILRLTDVEALASLTHEVGAQLAVDSTIATPVGLRPLDLGADFVVHSLTKYACGHGNALGGAVLGSRDRMATLRRDSLVHLGAAMNAFAAATIIQGLATLTLRMDAHQKGALAVARFLEAHPRVTRVLYPGLDSHPQRELAVRQMHNTSGLLSFQVRDPAALLSAISGRLQVVTYAVSLGKHRSLLYYIPTDDILRTSYMMDGMHSERYREWAGEGVFRLSVGLEAPEDLIYDLTRILG